MAFAPAFALVFFLIMRPMELVPGLAALRPLDALTALSALGVIGEFATGKQRRAWSPQLPWLGAFFAWAFLVTIARLGPNEGAHAAWNTIGLATIFMLVVTFAARSFARLRALAMLLTICLGTVCAVAVHQGLQPAQCIALVPDENGDVDVQEGEPDGRECEGAHWCELTGRSGVDYACEKTGLFGTTSIGQRVRWRGQLADPNELSVFVGVVLPLTLACATTLRKRWFNAVAAIVFAVSLWAVVLSQSRSGQIVIGVVFLLYFVKRYGAKGAVLAVLATTPVVLFGGREGAEADSSALERATILYEGCDLLRAHPLIGVGIGQFAEEISLPHTAHNSYLLAAAELGVLGCVLWCGLMYASFKIPFVIARRPPPGLDPRVVPFATALWISFVAMFVGVFFLSFCYKQLLFVYLGLAGALYGLVRRHDPSFRVTTTRNDGLLVVGAALTLLVATFVISRIKGAG